MPATATSRETCRSETSSTVTAMKGSAPTATADPAWLAAVAAHRRRKSAPQDGVVGGAIPGP